MIIQDLLEKCEDAYECNDFKRLLKLSDEVLGIDSKNQIAIGYKSISYCFLNQPNDALKLLKKAIGLYPNNYYYKNNAAIAYYELGEYEKSLKCCNEGLNIKNFDWLYENKIKALLKLDRVDEAIECYENSPILTEIYDLMIEAGKFSEAFRYCLDEDLDDFASIIDKIKEENAQAVGEYYISWIGKIKFRYNTRFCPDCGGELIPIVWGYPNPEMFQKAERGEIFLGGCVLPPNNPNYHCKNCDNEFLLGYRGLQIECEDHKLYEYVKYKIRQLHSNLLNNSSVFVRSIDGMKKELKGFVDDEFDLFINHLIEIDYLYQPREGYIKLVGFEDLNTIKEYLEDNKFAAPQWLVYPQLSAWTIGWRMGAGENYVMNMPYSTEEFKKLFPKPQSWSFRASKSLYKPHPLLGYFWSEDGKPKYPNSPKGIEVNDFIGMDDEKEFYSDAFTFKSIEHAVLLSKYLYFDKYGQKDKDFDELNELKLAPDAEKRWEIYNYSVILNASYFKVMQDENLKKWLLETGNEPLIYISDDGENLFGRALMELRDEIRRICKNEDKIDWQYTEYLKWKPWMS